MKQFYRNGDNFYIIHRSIGIPYFTDKNGVLKMEFVKAWRNYLNGVDHVLRTDSHFLFVETIQDAVVVEE
tara:strand:+ start:1350 stop:1559 length:210 start_codon:yes stop_codon:yes gene_type:complete